MLRILSNFLKQTLLLLIILSVTACDNISQSVKETNDHSSLVVEETADSITCMLPDGGISVIPKHPKRTIVLLTSLLNLWVESGGTAIARCTGDINVPPEVINIPEVGSFNNPNAEKVITLQPDLVISSDVAGFRYIIPILKQNNIPYIFLRYVNHYDYLHILDLFSRINGTEKIYQAANERMSERINIITERCRKFKGPKALVVFTSTNSVSCELPNSQTGVMLSMIGVKNIISKDYNLASQTRVDFSLEKIVQLDPDIILLNTMGEVDACRERLRMEFESNEAWSALTAIREGRFHVLPKKYFLYKPNDEFPRALEYLARLIYPDFDIPADISHMTVSANTDRRE